MEGPKTPPANIKKNSNYVLEDEDGRPKRPFTVTMLSSKLSVDLFQMKDLVMLL